MVHVYTEGNINSQELWIMMPKATLSIPEFGLRQELQRVRIRTYCGHQTPHRLTISWACWDRQRHSLGCNQRGIWSYVMRHLFPAKISGISLQWLQSGKWAQVSLSGTLRGFLNCLLILWLLWHLGVTKLRGAQGSISEDEPLEGLARRNDDQTFRSLPESP